MNPSAWDTLLAWLAMGGYGLYVWGSLAMCALVIAGELLALRAQRHALLAEAAAPGGDAEPVAPRRPVITRTEAVS
jgi:heme exporter protein D